MGSLDGERENGDETDQKDIRVERVECGAGGKQRECVGP
jgi:hypothetical protein